VSRRLLAAVRSGTALLPLGLLALALAVRLYRLDQVPPGLYFDEATNGVDTMTILSGRYPVFFEQTFGREPLFIYLQALSVGLLGRTAFALRLTAAVVGSATILAAYWLVRELYGRANASGRSVALWTALFLALSYWHIALSRLGFRAISLPLVACLAFAAFWRAWRALEAGSRSWAAAVGCGLLVGLSAYTYLASRFLPLLLLASAGVGVVATDAAKVSRRRGLLALTAIAVVAMLVFAPLGYYFLTHPGSFIGRASMISAFNPQLNQGHVLSDLAGSVAKTAAMFGFLGDPNLRHNPAGRPALEWWLLPWMVAGVGLAIGRRSRPGLFALVWCIVFALPAVVTTSTAGMPSHLRTVAMAPGVYLLVAQGLEGAGEWLSRVRPRLWPALPLAFLLPSAALGLNSYFAAFRTNPDLGRLYFDTAYSAAAQALSLQGEQGSVWVIPRSPLFFGPDSWPQPVLTFLYHGVGSQGQVLADAEHAPAQLASVTSGQGRAFLVRWLPSLGLPDGAYTLADPKDLVAFLLAKHGRLVEAREADGISYRVYDLPSRAEYRLAIGYDSYNACFGGAVCLVEAAHGHAAISAMESPEALEDGEVPSGRNAWFVLRWQAQAPVAIDLKCTLYLVDEEGHLAGQVDDLLVSDRYPFSRTWDAGEAATTYHILPVLPAVPPGEYQVRLGVYEAENGRRYPLLDGDGQPAGQSLLLATLSVSRQLETPAVAPQFSTAAGAAIVPGLRLLGYDLPLDSLQPGQTLPLTLYWKARAAPEEEPELLLALRTEAGELVVQRRGPLAEGRYPVTRWSAGEVVRDWQELTLPPDLPVGDYWLTLSPAVDPGTVLELGAIQVAGRPRVFEPPPIRQPLVAVLDGEVALLGYDLDVAMVEAGSILRLTLYWRAQAAPSTSYTVFAHLLSPTGVNLCGSDSLPGGGSLPTNTWLPGEVVADTYEIAVPADAPVGEGYQVELGMYDASTGQRLSVSGQGADVVNRRILLPSAIIISAPR